jgi:hypothetical protein
MRLLFPRELANLPIATLPISREERDEQSTNCQVFNNFALRKTRERQDIANLIELHFKVYRKKARL